MRYEVTRYTIESITIDDSDGPVEDEQEAINIAEQLREDFWKRENVSYDVVAL